MTAADSSISLQTDPSPSPVNAEQTPKTTKGFAHPLCRWPLVAAKVVGLLAFLYFFVCSLDLMSSAFRLLGGKLTGQAFGEGSILSNPIAGLMLGLLSTVIVQSSSTSTSIVVAMVSSSILPVRRAVPIIMGANIGTSVTNTIVALSQSRDRDQFSLSFAGATVHDMFNWLTVLVLLPLEIASGMLFHLTDVITRSIPLNGTSTSNPEFLTVLTKPLTEKIVQLDRRAITNIAVGVAPPSQSLLRRFCSFREANSTNGSVVSVGDGYCSHLFARSSWPDWSIGLLLLSVSLVGLCLCLYLLVKVLQSLLKGTVKEILTSLVNANFPGCFAVFTPYVAILVGCALTIVVQSSSIFTSTLTPLVGLGVISLERVYPFTLGSNLGTTVTGILAALTSNSAAELKNSLQIALCHTFFNIIGIVLWFPLPHLRYPIPMAKKLGEITGRYRWFAFVYIVGAFLLVPLLVFGLSVAGWFVFAGVLGPFVVLLLLVLLVTVLQRSLPGVLPSRLRTWQFLPLPFRSLRWYDDHLFNRTSSLCRRKRIAPQAASSSSSTDESEMKESSADR